MKVFIHFFIPKAASIVALTPCGDEGEELLSRAGSSIITVAETLPRGATSLLSVSFSPPKLLILKSACKPCPQPPLFPSGPAQPAAAWVAQPGAGSLPRSAGGVDFSPSAVKGVKRPAPFPLGEPRDVVGESVGRSLPPRAAEPFPAAPRSAGTRSCLGKGFGHFPGSMGFFFLAHASGV